MSINTAERLAGYYPFSEETIDTVAEFAERQAAFSSYQNFFENIGIGDKRSYSPIGWDEKYAIEILDVRPDEHDPAEAILYRLPMANPLDPNQIFQIATIAATNPNRRIIAAGNPSGGEYSAGALPKHKRKAVADNNLSFLSIPLREYADSQGVEKFDEVGGSFGANVAVNLAHHWNIGNIVAIEPVVGKRSLLKLGLDFASSANALDGYVEAADLETFKDARGDSVTAMQYNRGLMRLTNLAIARALTVPRFEGDSSADLMYNPNTSLSIIWGSKSELAIDGLMKNLQENLQHQFTPERVQAIRLEGQKHALANDVHLQAAIVLEGTKHRAA